MTGNALDSLPVDSASSDAASGGVVDQLALRGMRLVTDEAVSPRVLFPVAALTPDLPVWLDAHRDELKAALRSAATWREVSGNERAFYFKFRRDPSDGTDNVGIAITIQSVVDRLALRRALQHLIDRHALLRSVYRWSRDQPERQATTQAVSLVEVDASSFDDEVLHRHLRVYHHQPFNLATGPVFRAHLLSRSDTEHYLLCAASHAVADGVSLSTVLNDLRLAYESAVSGEATLLPPLAHTYDDYVSSQRAERGSEARERDWVYWREVLRDVPAHTGISDPSVPADAPITGHSVPCTLAESSGVIHQAAREHGTTPFVVLLAAWHVCLAQLTGTSRLVIGVPVAGRAGSALRGVVGNFMNLVPVVLDLADGETFADRLADVSARLTRARKHGDYPYAELVERVSHDSGAAPRDFARIGFVLHRARGALAGLSHALSRGSVDFGGLLAGPCELPNQETAFDLAAEFYELGHVFRGHLKARSDRVAPATLRRLAHHYVALVPQLLAHAAEPIAASYGGEAIDLTTAAEPTRLSTAGVADTSRLTPTELFIAQAWSDLLGMRPHADQSFFESGGHSLLAVQLVTRLRETYGVEVPLRTVFDAPTVSQLAAYIDAARRADVGHE